MKHVNEIAVISSIECNGSLLDWCTENDAVRIRFCFSYEESEHEEGLLDLAALGCKTGKTYSVLANFDGKCKSTEKEINVLVKSLSEKIVGGKVRMSTYDYTISELTDNEHESVSNDSRTYSSLSNSYFGKMEDEDSAFKSVKARLNQMVEDGAEFDTDD